jgi:glycosyltransferase involved in cell wall biosynthesis
MRVIAYVRQNSGPCYHRIIMPLLLMPNVDVYITNNLQVEHFDQGCDVFIYNRIIPDHAMPQLYELQNKMGFAIGVDLDDFWELDPHHILYEDYKDREFAKEQIDHIKRAGFVTTTHQRLADEIAQYNPDVHVLPNAIPNAGQFQIEREPCKYTRLFWQGSITHAEDISLLRTAIHHLGPLSTKIKMVMGGYTQGEPEWHKMAMDYTAQLKHQYKLLPGCHVTEYYKHYKEADICLVPLVNSPFNRHKSNLKVLEAAHLGLPVIASPVHPYLDMPLLYAKNSTEWIQNIRRLVASKKRQKEAGAELKEYCDQHFNFDKINLERKQIFEHVAATI